jgi:hypothetical protein
MMHARDILKNPLKAWMYFVMADKTLSRFRSGELSTDNIEYPPPASDLYRYRFYYEASLAAYYAGIRDLSSMITWMLNGCIDMTLMPSILSNAKFYVPHLASGSTFSFTDSFQETPSGSSTSL